MARNLRAQGISTRALKRIVEKLRESGGGRQPLTDARFIVAGKDVLKVGATREELVSLLTRPNQAAFAFVFDLAKTATELQIAVQNDKPTRMRPPRVKRAAVKKKAS